MAHRTIDTTQELAELCARARDTGRIALDTEFLWERTYAPLICLVQLNVDGDVAIADPLERVGLEPVAEVLEDPDVEVVMHAPHADLVAFALRYGTRPANVFDTQIAAGFIGLSAGLSYERLVAETTGEQVSPSESFSDWSRRPLSQKQLRYAGEDVEFLFDAADHIRQRLQELGRVEWAREEMDRRFVDPARLGTQPGEAWRKVARRGKLAGRDLAVLREVAAWRERTARARDLPTSWVAKDPTLVEVARRAPTREEDLRKIRGVDQGIKRSDAEALLVAVQAGREGEAPDDGPPAPRVVRKRVAIAKGLATALLRAHCESEDIAPELVGTSQDVEDLITWVTATGRHAEALPRPSLLGGWRERFGSNLVDLVEGRVQLQLSTREPYLLIHRDSTADTAGSDDGGVSPEVATPSPGEAGSSGGRRRRRVRRR